MHPPVSFSFASARTANRLVAGVPAAARLARAWGEVHPGGPLILALPGSGVLAPLTRAEIARLAPNVPLVVREAGDQQAIPGEVLPDAAVLAALLAGTSPFPSPPADPDAALAAAGRRILKATAKPGDGNVSRHLNRP